MNKYFLLFFLFIQYTCYCQLNIQNYENLVNDSETMVENYFEVLNENLDNTQKQIVFSRAKELKSNIFNSFRENNVLLDDLYIENNTSPRVYCNNQQCANDITIEENKIILSGKNDYISRLVTQKIIRLNVSNIICDAIDFEKKYIFVTYNCTPHSKRKRYNFKCSNRVAILQYSGTSLKIFRIKYLTNDIKKDIYALKKKNTIQRIDYCISINDYQEALSIYKSNKYIGESYHQKIINSAEKYFKEKIENAMAISDYITARRYCFLANQNIPNNNFVTGYLNKIDEKIKSGIITNFYNYIYNCDIPKAKQELNNLKKVSKAPLTNENKALKEGEINCLLKEYANYRENGNINKQKQILLDLHTKTEDKSFLSKYNKLLLREYREQFKKAKDVKSFSEKKAYYESAFIISKSTHSDINSKKAEIKLLKLYSEKAKSFQEMSEKYRKRKDLFSALTEINNSLDVCREYEFKSYYLKEKNRLYKVVRKQANNDHAKIEKKINKLRRRGGDNRVHLYKYRYQKRKFSKRNLYFGISYSLLQVPYNQLDLNANCLLDNPSNGFKTINNNMDFLNYSSYSVNINYWLIGVYAGDYINTADYRQINIGGYLKLWKSYYAKFGYILYEGDPIKSFENTLNLSIYPYEYNKFISSQTNYYIGISKISPLLQFELGYNMLNSITEFKVGLNIWFYDAFSKNKKYKEARQNFKHYKRAVKSSK